MIRRLLGCFLVILMLFPSAEMSGRQQSRTKKVTTEKRPAPKKPQRRSTTTTRNKQQVVTKEPSAKVKKTPPKPNQPTPTAVVSSRPSEDEVIGTTRDGNPVYAGLQGGHYILHSEGKRVSVGDAEIQGARTAGRTPEGIIIYDGPRSGPYYYNSNGNKTYVPRTR